MADPFRIGLIVPSSNTTMETEIPSMLRRRSEVASDQFTFHSSRVRLRQVNSEELGHMVRESDRCALELSDARVDIMAYACLVAVMAQGANAHNEIERQLTDVAAENGSRAPVFSSAGALIHGLQALDAARVGIVAPYVPQLTALVVDYLRNAGIDVVDAISLEIPDNLEVGRVDPASLPGIAERLDLSNADCVVLSACVQMPSLPAIEVAEQQLGLPVVSASIATTYEILQRLGLEPVVPGAGQLLSGRLRTPEVAAV